jgi:O-antigen ligase
MQPASDNSSTPARIVLAGACIAIFFSAFELIEPIISLGPIVFTSSELAAAFFFMTVAYWIVREPAWIMPWRALDLAVFLFLAVSFVSSSLAEDRPSALKFSLRMTYAALIYFGISRLPGRKYKSHIVVSGAIAMTVLVVVLIGFVETLIFSRYYFQPLSIFQEGVATFGSFYNLRTTSTLPFPTAFSFYLELTLPVLLALALWYFGSGDSWWKSKRYYIITVAGIAAVYFLQIYSFTRTGLVALPVALIVGALLAWYFRLGKNVWRLFSLAVLMLPALVVILSLVSNTVAARFGLAEQEMKYDADYALVKLPEGLMPGEEYIATVKVTNISKVDWTRDGRARVFISSRWIKYPDGERAEVDPIPSLLPGDLAIGDTADAKMTFTTPDEYGRYILVIDLFKRHVSWFSDAGSYPLLVPIEIDAAGSRTFQPEEVLSLEKVTISEPILESVPRSKLWEAAVRMWRDHPLLGVGSDQYRLRYGEYFPESRHDERLRTHNIFLEALANNGIVGLLVMVYLLGAAAWTQLGIARDRGNEDDLRYYGLALLVSMTVYVLHGMLDIFLWQTGATYMFFALLGLTSWMAHAAKRSR